MIVLDTSALVEALLGDPIDLALRDRIGAVDEIHVPHLIDVEFLAALRGLGRRGSVSADLAIHVIREFAQWRLTRYPHEPLLERAWEWRDAISPYDAMFVALAAELEMPLVTCDRRLARTASRFVEVETFGGRA